MKPILDITIERAAADDIDSMCGLLVELFSIEPDFSINYDKQRQGLELLLSDPDNSLALVAKEQGKTIGMCTAQFLISTAEGGRVAVIEDLIISKQYRGQGVGSMILEELQNNCWKNNCSRLTLLADKENVDALNFYRHHGWETARMICLRKIQMGRL